MVDQGVEVEEVTDVNVGFTVGVGVLFVAFTVCCCVDFDTTHHKGEACVSEGALLEHGVLVDVLDATDV